MPDETGCPCNVIPPAYSEMIMSPRPPIRRWPLGTSRGVNEPSRSGAPQRHRPGLSLNRLSRAAICGRWAAAGQPDHPSRPAQMPRQLSGQTTLQRQLDQPRQQPHLTGQRDLTAINLSQQRIHHPEARSASAISTVETAPTNSSSLRTSCHTRDPSFPDLHRPSDTSTPSWVPVSPHRPPPRTIAGDRCGRPFHAGDHLASYWPTPTPDSPSSAPTTTPAGSTPTHRSGAISDTWKHSATPSPSHRQPDSPHSERHHNFSDQWFPAAPGVGQKESLQ